MSKCEVFSADNKPIKIGSIVYIPYSRGVIEDKVTHLNTSVTENGTAVNVMAKMAGLGNSNEVYISRTTAYQIYRQTLLDELDKVQERLNQVDSVIKAGDP